MAFALPESAPSSKTSSTPHCPPSLTRASISTGEVAGLCSSRVGTWLMTTCVSDMPSMLHFFDSRTIVVTPLERPTGHYTSPVVTTRRGRPTAAEAHALDLTIREAAVE